MYRHVHRSVRLAPSSASHHRQPRTLEHPGFGWQVVLRSCRIWILGTGRDSWYNEIFRSGPWSSHPPRPRCLQRRPRSPPAKCSNCARSEPPDGSRGTCYLVFRDVDIRIIQVGFEGVHISGSKAESLRANAFLCAGRRRSPRLHTALLHTALRLGL